MTFTTLNASQLINKKRAQIAVLSEELFQLEKEQFMTDATIDAQTKKQMLDDLTTAQQFVLTVNELRTHHLGYPGNFKQNSPLYHHFRQLEAELPLLNNIGDIFDEGNARLHSKKWERDILNLFAEKFGLTDNWWGYLTSGGSESNDWAINQGRSLLPDSIFYHSTGAHYSITKSSTNFMSEAIPTCGPDDERINVDLLTQRIQENYERLGLAANIVLTWGTTKYGAIDDVWAVKKFLIAHHIPHYLHLDAAHFGGIPNNQIGAPIIDDIRSLGVHSISVSLHKYIGLPQVKGVLLSVEEPATQNAVDYIGQKDTTSCGSRDLLPFSTKQQVLEMLKLSDPNDYQRNIRYFEARLNERKIPFIRYAYSNTFVIAEPSSEICSHYQLSQFKNDTGHKKAHVIIFPYQSQAQLLALANDLANDSKAQSDMTLNFKQRVLQTNES
ncbi:hypothetical protein H9L19_02235 [Weissella diestrammenae]|uniref:Histidine decarboxylase n=1 Tax=Weissella diestrammenae TaxID=1162633 RepID=A0A7G9T6I4_9LACO|nr:pyridoxal-dependent decarboxylase [Weissella diestrammenae]MCM0583236.1 hypothetical protein [Weissella diestrammenae]QNN75709.1 hypothetical protein H9L19_02235 [Weissella diestrammenae]